MHGTSGARWIGLAAVLLLVTGACSISDQPTRSRSSRSTATTNAAGEFEYGPAVLSGAVVSGDDPVADAPMVVQRVDTEGDSLGSFVARFVAGYLCTVDSACTGAKSIVERPATDAEGDYEIALPEAYLAGYETDTDWFVTVSRPAAEGALTGPASTFELEVNTPRPVAPDLALWDVLPAVEDEDGVVSVEVGAPPEAEGRPSVRFVTERGSTVWSFPDDTDGSVDSRLLEDVPLRVLGVVDADPRVEHEDGNTIYHQYLATPMVAYGPGAAPPSRRAACEIESRPGEACPLTDGDLTEQVSFEEGSGTTVDLGAPTELGLVVVRGGAQPSDEDRGRRRDDDRPLNLQVEASVDGTTWDLLPAERLEGAAGISASGSAPVQARYLRVTTPGGGGVSEISAWPPLPLREGGSSWVGVLPTPGDGDDGDRSVGAVALALVLIAGVVVAGAWVRKRVR
jgi:hypothetical protein